jgi:peroxidase
MVRTPGGHTIGVGHCNLFSSRLFNFTGKNNLGDVDPSLNPPYAKFLQVTLLDRAPTYAKFCTVPPN